MNQHFEHEFEKRMLSDDWDLSMAKAVLQKRKARLRRKISFIGGAAAACICISFGAAFFHQSTIVPTGLDFVTIQITGSAESAGLPAASLAPESNDDTTRLVEELLSMR